MPKTIQHAVRFSASPDQLFDIYMNSRKHSAAIQAEAVISWDTHYWNPWRAYLRRKR